MNGDSLITDVPFFMIYGTKGILKLTCANDFGGQVELLPASDSFTPKPALLLENTSPITGAHRGIGPAELALSIECGKPNRADKEMAYHVLEVIGKMIESNEKKIPLKVRSTCTIPTLLSEEELKQICG